MNEKENYAKYPLDVKNWDFLLLKCVWWYLKLPLCLDDPWATSLIIIIILVSSASCCIFVCVEHRKPTTK